MSELRARGLQDGILSLIALAIIAFVVIGILLMTGVFNAKSTGPLDTELMQEHVGKHT
jgi:hypothetical protein